MASDRDRLYDQVPCPGCGLGDMCRKCTRLGVCLDCVDADDPQRGEVG